MGKGANISKASSVRIQKLRIGIQMAQYTFGEQVLQGRLERLTYLARYSGGYVDQDDLQPHDQDQPGKDNSAELGNQEVSHG